MDEQLKKIQEKYGVYEGILVDDLHIIHDISSYNYNYYVGLKRKDIPTNDLLFGESDDDDTTIWYIIENCRVREIGYSFVSEGDFIHLGILI